MLWRFLLARNVASVARQILRFAAGCPPYAARTAATTVHFVTGGRIDWFCHNVELPCIRHRSGDH